MGFETKSCHQKDKFWRIMRYPYGIWNNLDRFRLQNFMILWDIPMGFETNDV